MLAAIGAAKGASIGELVVLTGWVPHTTRAALTRLKQRGFALQRIRTAERHAYYLVTTGQG